MEFDIVTENLTRMGGSLTQLAFRVLPSDGLKGIDISLRLRKPRGLDEPAEANLDILRVAFQFQRGTARGRDAF
jgi:hypothetical protein